MPIVHLKNAKCEYRLELKHKFTIIRGDSGIGKTTFYNMVVLLNRRTVVIKDRSNITVKALTTDDFIGAIEKNTGCVFVLDENHDLLFLKNAGEFLRNSNNYFIIISRKRNLGYLPVHLDPICTIEYKNGVGQLVPIYQISEYKNNSNIVYTEDSKSGKQFIELLGEFKTLSAGECLNQVGSGKDQSFDKPITSISAF